MTKVNNQYTKLLNNFGLRHNIFNHHFHFSQINMCCEDSLMTPLHVAVKAQQISSVVSIVDLDPRFDITDTNGDTVFHYAATTTKDIIQVTII